MGLISKIEDKLSGNSSTQDEAAKYQDSSNTTSSSTANPATSRLQHPIQSTTGTAVSGGSGTGTTSSSGMGTTGTSSGMPYNSSSQSTAANTTTGAPGSGSTRAYESDPYTTSRDQNPMATSGYGTSTSSSMQPGTQTSTTRGQIPYDGNPATTGYDNTSSTHPGTQTLSSRGPNPATTGYGTTNTTSSLPQSGAPISNTRGEPTSYGQTTSSIPGQYPSTTTGHDTYSSTQPGIAQTSTTQQPYVQDVERTRTGGVPNQTYSTAPTGTTTTRDDMVPGGSSYATRDPVHTTAPTTTTSSSAIGQGPTSTSTGGLSDVSYMHRNPISTTGGTTTTTGNTLGGTSTSGGVGSTSQGMPTTAATTSSGTGTGTIGSTGLSQAKKLGGAYEAGYRDAMEHMKAEMGSKWPFDY